MSTSAPESAELANKMTGIEDLPCELALQLAHSLPFKDFCHLRRPCKRIAVYTKEDFVKHATTKPLYIFPTRAALQKLKSFVQDKRVKHLVSHVRDIAIFSSIEIEGSTVLGLNDFYKAHRKEGGRDDCSPCSKFGSYYNDRFYSRHKFRDALTVILRDLPGVRVSVHRDASDSIYVWGMQELELELSSGQVTIPDLDSSSHGHYVNRYGDVDKITHNRINLHVLEACGDSGISMLGICHLNPNRVHWFDKDGQRSGIRLARWLNFLPGLERVTLKFSWHDPERDELSLKAYRIVIQDIAGHWEPRNLKSLAIESGKLPENDFVKLLLGNKSKLTELRLLYVRVTGEEERKINKEAWMRIFALLNYEFVELERVSIRLTGGSAPYDVIAGRDDDLKAEFSRSIKALGGVDVESVGT